MKTASIGLIAALLLTAGPVGAQFSGGSGSSADPYIIATAADLDAIRGSYLGTPGIPVYYSQTANIGLAAYTNWQPIGNQTTPARVVYDGNNYRIWNLTINRPTESTIGLFGMLAGTVRNLHLESGNVSGNGYVGAIAGRLDVGGVIEDSASRLTVSGTGGIAGGLVGYNAGTLRRVFIRSATVSGDNQIGGLVGINAGAIETSYAAAAVSGTRNTGGLAGGSSSGAVTASYWDTAVSGQPSSYGGGTGLGTAAMQQRASFATWDFNSVWRLYEGRSYPYLRALASTVAAPVADPGTGSYTGESVAVVLTSPTANATIHFTLNGAAPDDQSTSVPSGGTVTVPLPGTLRAIAWVPYMNPSPAPTFTYEAAPQVETPQLSPDAGSFPGASVAVTVTVGTADSTMRYTLDGSAPTPDTPTTVADGGSVTVPLPGTLNVRAFHATMNPSDVASGVYAAADRVDTPTLSPAGGAFPGEQVEVELTVVTADAAIRYTIDGSEPTEANGTQATSGDVVQVPLLDGANVLKAKAFHPDFNTSLTATGSYHRAAAAAMPTFDPPGGDFTSGHVAVTLASATADATIRYTLDGSEPQAATSSAVTNGGSVTVPITVEGTVLKARAFHPDYNPSDVRSATFQAADPVATPVFTPDGGPQAGSSVSVTITCTTPGATIRYMIGGLAPAVDSPVIADGATVTVPVPGVLRARAWHEGMFTSDIRTAYYGDFAGGSGTASDPHLVATPTHLDNVRNDLTAHYRLVGDIDLDVSPWNSGAGWDPIGSWSDRFTGVLDGAGYAVRNMQINRPTEEDVGVIGVLGSTGKIMNIGVANGSFVGKQYVGGLVGWSYGSVSNSFAAVAVTGERYVGGLVGGMQEGTISRSYAHSTVEASSAALNSPAGGLVGGNLAGWITDSFAGGAVSCPDIAGGLVGRNEGTLTRVYAFATLPQTARVAGGLIGELGSTPGSVSSAYWDTEASGMATSAGPETGLPTTEMWMEASFAGWDFDAVWVIDEGQDYPRLRVFEQRAVIIPDAWLIDYYGAVDMAPNYSVKGRLLWKEYVAGTDPTDPDSVFEISRSEMSGATLQVRVPSVTGRVYRAQTRASLTTGPGWTDIDGVAAQAGTGAVLTFDIPTPPSSAFYCIMVSLDAP